MSQRVLSTIVHRIKNLEKVRPSSFHHDDIVLFTFVSQHEGHNIFGHLNSTEYKQVLGYIKDCILATDLATFFGNKARLGEIVNNEGFQVDNQMHR